MKGWRVTPRLLVPVSFIIAVALLLGSASLLKQDALAAGPNTGLKTGTYFQIHDAGTAQPTVYKINNLSFGAAINPIQSGAGAGKVTPSASPVTIDRNSDDLTPLLWNDMFTGKRIPTIEIDINENTGKSIQTAEKITLGTVHVQSIQTNDASQHEADETVVLNYAQIKIDRYSYDSTGKLINTSTFTWNFATDSPSWDISTNKQA